MIPQQILDNANAYIVASYSVITGKSTNMFGHGHLLFSYYCPETNRMVVDDGMGLYSTPLPKERTWRRMISQFGFFDEGHILQEKYRYLSSNAGSKHFHKSWKISPDQYDALIKKINLDRGAEAPLENRNFQQEDAALTALNNLSPAEKAKKIEEINKKDAADHLKAQGPRFSATQHTCKTDALKRLAAVGINTQGIHNRIIDLPIHSGKMAMHTLEYDQTRNQLVWQSPLELSPQKTYAAESSEMQAKILAQRQYHLLMNNLKEMIALFDLKLNDTGCKQASKLVVQQSRDELNNLLNTMFTAGLDPEHITGKQVDAYFTAYRGIVNTAKATLGKTEPSFTQKILDKFIELCTQFSSLIAKPNVVIYSEGHLLKKADENLTQLDTRLKSGKSLRC